MNLKQSTIKKDLIITGVGLHTGKTVTLTFKPAPENHGIKFQRIDLPEQTIIDADVDLVVDTSRGTTLEYKGARISTIEHAMAAIAALEIDNLLITVDGPEVPILDGSSIIYIDEINKTGIQMQNADREYFVIPQNIHFSDEEKGVEIMAMPLDDYRITVMVDYNSPVLGSQHASITNLKEFKKEIAPARTFCFLHELEQLLDANLIKGGDLGNAIVIVDKEVSQKELDRLAILLGKPKVEVKKEGILNNVDLRYQNEPARHKLLDVIGDLALIGMPLKCQIMAARTGHASNVAFAKKVKQLIKKNKNKNSAPKYDPNQKPLYDYNDIANMLPHKFPFLLVDKVMSMTPTSVIAIKNVTADQYFFQGHFPGNPIMPGVLLLEAMGQAGGTLILSKVEDPENYSTYFVKMDAIKFKGKVVPGDTLIMKLDLVGPVRRGICIMKGVAFVGDTMVCEAELTALIVKDKVETNTNPQSQEIENRSPSSAK